MTSLLVSSFQKLAKEVICRKPQKFCIVQSMKNSNHTSLRRINRNVYVRQYPTMVVLPDGSTISIRYKEPRKIIQLPLDLSTLTEEERQARLRRRKPKKKIVIEEDIEDNFDVNRYSHLWKK